MEFNIYTVIISAICAVSIIIIFILLLRSGKNISISKDGIIMTTKDGKFVSHDKIIVIIFEIRNIESAIIQIEKNDIIYEQMKYLERESEVYYANLLKMIPANKKLYYEIFKSHRLQMLDIFRDELIKKNHFLEKSDWLSYQRQMSNFTFNAAISIFDKMADNLDEDGIKVERVMDNKDVRGIYDERFYVWMDTFKEITRNKLEEVKKLKQHRQELLEKIGYNI